MNDTPLTLSSQVPVTVDDAYGRVTWLLGMYLKYGPTSPLGRVARILSEIESDRKAPDGHQNAIVHAHDLAKAALMAKESAWADYLMEAQTLLRQIYWASTALAHDDARKRVPVAPPF